MTKVKICGITREVDARCAIEAGADYLGLIFAPSKRKIIKETALRILHSFPSYNSFVGVFMNEKKKIIEEICDYTGIQIVQFHGDESPAFCNYFINRGIEVIKAFRVRDASSIEKVSAYNKVGMYLFDTYSPEHGGGTGKTFDWHILDGQNILKEKNVIMSGGLYDENVKSVIAAVRPFAVDASSCLEVSPGVKDCNKIKKFIAAVKAGEDRYAS